MRRRILIALAIGVGTILGAALLVLLYLNFADLGGYKGTVENLLTDALGRKVRIAGDLQIDFGFDSKITAGGVTLANPEWSDDPSMVSIEHLEGKINLFSLLRAPIRIHRFEATGATVLLEKTDDGRANWLFETGTDDTDEPSGPLRLSVGRVELNRAILDLRIPSLEKPLVLTLDRLDIESDAADMLTLQLDGDLNDSNLMLGGRLGTLAELLDLGRVSHDLEGSLGNAGLALNGEIGELATLRNADIQLAIDGPTMSEMTDLLGLPDLGSGPFHILATAVSTGEVSSVSLDSALGEVKLSASGTVDALLAPEILDLEFLASGPSMAAVAAMAGVKGAAHKPFSASGHLRWEGFPLTFDNVEMKVGDNTVSLDGTLGQPPTMLGTDFQFAADGPDISSISLLGGVDLPAGAFEVNGRLVRLEHGVGVQGIDAKIGPTTATIDGTVGDPPEFDGTNLRVEAKGPDLSALSGLVGTRLPALPFTVAGKLTPEENAVVLEGVRANLGPNNARIEGTVVTDMGFAGTDLHLVAEGPDLTWLEQPTGFTDLPRKPFRIEGGVVVEQTGYRLRDVSARVGEVTARVDGRLGALPRFDGTSVTLVAEGPDISIPASLAGFSGLPAKPFRVQGDIKKGGEWLELEGVEAQIGEGWINLSGRIATTADGMGTQLQAEGAGPDASVFGPLFELNTLPPEPYSFSGGIRFESEGYILEDFEADLGWARAQVDGTVVPASHFAGTDVTFSIAAPLLSTAGAIVHSTGLIDLPALPPEPVAVVGGVAVDEDGFQLRDLRATLGAAEAEISGRLGRPPQFHGTDLTVNADGPDASLFTALTGVSVPVAPFRTNGRFELVDEGLRFHSLSVQLGEYRITANGFLGEPPKLIGTDLDVEASGPSLALVADLAGIKKLPDLPFSVVGSFDGDPSRFKSDQLTATLGSSDITGSFRLDITSRPNFTGTFTSKRLDFAEMFPVRDPADEPSEVPEEPASRGGFVISNEPFDLGFLDFADGEFSVSVDQLMLRTQALKDLRVEGELHNGRLEVDQLSAAGGYDGILDGTLLLEPAKTGYRLATDFTLEESRIDLSTSHDDPSEWPTFDFTVNFDSTGRSPHELAAAANGRMKMIAGEGVIERSLVDVLATGVLTKILEILNPFTSENPASMLNCAVVVVDFTDGVATLDPVTVQTDTLTILADGRIDFSTEELSVDWITKPRKGIGVSASLLTNPYIKVGGTLSKPSIEMKPLQAAASTGLAVATGGLSILGKGLLDRVTSEGKVCDQALKKAEKQLAKKEAGGR